MKHFIITLFNGNVIDIVADTNHRDAVDMAVQADFMAYLILEPLGVLPVKKEITFERYEMN